MKHILALLATALIATSTFAYDITDAQKKAFVACVESNVVDGDDFMASVEKTATMNEVKTVAEWAVENTLDYHKWVIEQKNKGHFLWVVRKAVNIPFDKGTLQDVVINDSRATFDAMIESKVFFDEMKNAGFEVEGVKISEGWIIRACVAHSDVESVELFVSEKNIVANFESYLLAIRKSNLTGVQLYNKYVSVVKRFSAYKEDKGVKEHWETLLTDKNEAYVDAYCAMKLGNFR